MQSKLYSPLLTLVCGSGFVQSQKTLDSVLTDATGLLVYKAYQSSETFTNKLLSSHLSCLIGLFISGNLFSVQTYRSYRTNSENSDRRVLYGKCYNGGSIFLIFSVLLGTHLKYLIHQCTVLSEGPTYHRARSRREQQKGTEI